MKRILLAVPLAVVALAGCGSSTTDQAQTAATTSSEDIMKARIAEAIAAYPEAYDEAFKMCSYTPSFALDKSWVENAARAIRIKYGDKASPYGMDWAGVALDVGCNHGAQNPSTP